MVEVLWLLADSGRRFTWAELSDKISLDFCLMTSFCHVKAKSSRKTVINVHQHHTALVQGQNDVSNNSFPEVQKLHSLAATEK